MYTVILLAYHFVYQHIGRLTKLHWVTIHTLGFLCYCWVAFAGACRGWIANVKIHLLLETIHYVYVLQRLDRSNICIIHFIPYSNPKHRTTRLGSTAQILVFAIAQEPPLLAAECSNKINRGIRNNI